MTALSDALQTAQSAALAALARQYVRGPLGAQDDGTGALIASLERLGLDDLVDATRWVACLDVLRETGSRPPGENGSAQRREEPDDRERQRINDAHAYGGLADNRKLVALGAQRDALSFELLRRRQNVEASAERGFDFFAESAAVTVANAKLPRGVYGIGEEGTGVVHNHGSAREAVAAALARGRDHRLYRMADGWRFVGIVHADGRFTDERRPSDG